MRSTARRTKLALVAGVLALTLAPGLVPAAQASDVDWLFGVGFNIGRFHFNIGGRYVDDHRYHGRSYHAPRWDYYFRVAAPIQYRGYHCSNSCYRDGGYSYHHASCPVVRHHFYRHGYDFDRVFYSYSPHRRYDDRRHDDRRHDDRRYDDRYYDDDRGYGYRRDGYEDRDEVYGYPEEGYVYRRDQGHQDRRYRDHGRYRGRGHHHGSGSSCPNRH